MTSIEQNGGKLLVPYFYAVEPGMTIGTYFTHQRTIQEHPDLVERFNEAINRSLEYAREHKQAARNAIASYTKIPPEVLPKIALPLWRSDLKPKSIQLQADLAQEFGFTEDRVDVSKIIWDGATGG